jgi:hypothetical protein
VVKAGVCKTPIGGSNPPVASKKLDSEPAVSRPVLMILVGFDDPTHGNQTLWPSFLRTVEPNQDHLATAQPSSALGGLTAMLR